MAPQSGQPDAQAAAFDAKTAELVASVAGGGGQTFRTV